MAANPVKNSKSSKFRDFTLFVYRMTRPLFDPLHFVSGVPRYIGFFVDMTRYSRMKGSEKIRAINLYPCIHNKTEATRFDPHYFYQDIWAFKKILESGVKHHADVGSKVDFVGFLTVITDVEFIDIRPLSAQLDNFTSKKGSILAMPFADNSVYSLSCLHVAEHIGLGRYGDKLDPKGTKKACKELARVLAPGGNLYFSLPVGNPRLCFNAHRIHSPKQILEYFNNLQLLEFSGIDYNKNFRRNIDISVLENSKYACGLFHFTKK